MAAALCFALLQGAAPVDPEYGLVEAKPVQVGGVMEGVARAQAYFARLRGPQGQKLSVERKGSCCFFETPNGLFDNMGLLDRYVVKYEGLAKPVTVFINIYDEGPLYPVAGFTLLKEAENPEKSVD